MSQSVSLSEAARSLVDSIDHLSGEVVIPVWLRPLVDRLAEALRGPDQETAHDGAVIGASFMQLIPAYAVKWYGPHIEHTGEHSLVVAQDDLQAVIRSIIRSAPTAKIEIEQVDMLPKQTIS